MDALQRGVLTLIKSGLTGEKLPLPGDFTLEQAEKLISSHQVTGLCCEGAALCGLDRQSPAMQSMLQKSFRLLIHNENQSKALERLLDAFAREGIDHLPVKGTVLKSLYPRPELRVMGDGDILLRKEQYPAAAGIMEQLGFRLAEETENVYAWDSPRLNVELHMSLLESQEREYAYYAHIWDRAVQLTEHRYGLSREQEYVFAVVHYAKHYRHGGIGLRQLTDLWLCQRKWELDMEAVQEALEQLELKEFWENTCKMLACWFEEGPETALTDFMTCYIFDSGSWGTAQQTAAAALLHKSRQEGSVEKARWRLALSSLFPGLAWMRRRYKVLEKAPVLLPVMWPVRWVDAALFRRQNVKKVRQKMADSSQENMEQFRQALESVGLK